MFALRQWYDRATAMLPQPEVSADSWPRRVVHWQLQREVEYNHACLCTSHLHHEKPAVSQPPNTLKEEHQIHISKTLKYEKPNKCKIYCMGKIGFEH